MPKVYLIGNSALRSEYEDILMSHGHNVIKFKSLDIVLQRIDAKTDVLIIDRKQNLNPSFKEFLKVTDLIPKIIITETRSLRGLARWTKGAFVYPLFTPGDKELLLFVNRLLQEKKLHNENITLKNELSLAKRELNFYEDINKTLTSSLALNDILTTIMKRAKEMTKAQAWSVLLVDEDTGALVFEKSEGKKSQSR